MVFKKNLFSAKLGRVAAAFLFLGSLFFVFLFFATFSQGYETWEYLVTILIVISLQGTGVAMLFFASDCNSEVVFSEEGILVKSHRSKSKYLAWRDCGLIGIYGYCYGLRGMLFFSSENYICYTQTDCQKFFNKHHKTAISMAYTQEVFAAVEKFAPPHCVSNLKILLREQKTP